jgi:hypothetical protein
VTDTDGVWTERGWHELPAPDVDVAEVRERRPDHDCGCPVAHAPPHPRHDPRVGRVGALVAVGLLGGVVLVAGWLWVRA